MVAVAAASLVVSAVGRSLLREWCFLVIGLSCLLVASQQWGWFSRGDAWAYDLAVAARARFSSATALSPADPLIIAIDEESLAWGGRWPWSRRRLAEAVDRLADMGSGPVLLDIILAEPSRDDPGADTQLAAAIARHGQLAGGVVLPALDDREQAVLPLDIFRRSARLGHVHALVDMDGITRRLLPQEWIGGSPYDHVAWPLLHQAAPTGDQAVLIPFAGSPGYFRRFSLAALLRDEVPPAMVRGCVVLVGATSSGLGDTVVTPLSGRGGALAGVEFVANTIQGLRSGNLATTLSSGWQLALSLPLLVGTLFFLLLASPRSALGTAVAAVCVVPLLSWLFLFGFNVWWPPASAVAAMILAYPLWSWRRLEASLNAMEKETQRMANLTSAPLAMAPTGRLLDPVAGRIEAISSAVDRIAGALTVVDDPEENRQHREEMLRHLAHDLRSPLISLRGLADELRTWMPQRDHIGTAGMDPLARIDQCARRALDLSEQFILLGRAQGTSLQQSEVNLVDLLHQCADELWEDARRQGGSVLRHCPLDGAWIKGDARLLHRALLNLGWNALRHGPAGGSVTLRLETEPGGILRLGVQDQGRGFSGLELAVLSASWQQGRASDIRGHGLGLTFVQQVAAAHGAELYPDQSPFGFTLWMRFTAGGESLSTG